MLTSFRRLLPPSAKWRIIRFCKSLDLFIIQFCSSNRWMASFYYFCLSREFDRELISVLNGRLAYSRSLSNIGITSPLLRRNIHRIEKGLIMKPRRNLFAEDYIIETVQVYQDAAKRKGYSSHEIQWASDILHEFFSVVKSSPIIDQAKKIFDAHNVTANRNDFADLVRYKPCSLSSSLPAQISFGGLNSLFLCRRSVRWFEPRHVPFELIQQITNTAASAPSACNRQPYRFIVANDPGHASAIAKCAGGTAGFSHQIPALIIVIGDLSAYPSERDRHLIYIDSALASMQLMLAACTVGLSTCPINWPDISSSERQLHKLIKLPKHERVIMLIAIGYGDPEGNIPSSQKKTGSLIVQRFQEDDY